MDNRIYGVLYDVVEKKEIVFWKDMVAEKCRELQLNSACVTNVLHQGRRSINSRYLNINNKNKIFTLCDFETDQEFDCITNKTMSIHLGKPLSYQECRRISELKNKSLHVTTIQGKLYYRKGEKPQFVLSKTKTEDSPSIIKQRKQYKIRLKIRQRLSQRLNFEIHKRINAKKNHHTLDLLGCSIEEFIKLIESKFQKGMSWDNYGEWHLDHEKPCCHFNILDEKEQRICFHHSNFQPLWAIDNMKKGRKEQLEKYKNLS